MIKPGWKRDVCPQCHMPGRVGERVEKAMKATKGISSFTLFLFTFPGTLDQNIKVDICDNCGVLYAYECKAPPKGTDASIED